VPGISIAIRALYGFLSAIIVKYLLVALILECLEYGKYPIGIRFRGLKEETIRKISIDGDPSDGAIYLYGDGTKPTHVFFA
jgi:hypothetical protein